MKSRNIKPEIISPKITPKIPTTKVEVAVIVDDLGNFRRVEPFLANLGVLRRRHLLELEQGVVEKKGNVWDEVE